MKISLITRFFKDPTFRKHALLCVLYGKSTFQKSITTSENRYPDLLKICSNYFSQSHTVKILSFGCSTGEEVFSIGKYMPDASIVGVDINYLCLNECHKKNIEGKYTFLHSKSLEFSRSGNFDAIFCLAVFQHTKNRIEDRKLAKKFTFKRFEDQLKKLDKKLKENGLLFIDHSDFDFRETSLYKNYTVLDIESNSIFRGRPLYNKINERISESTLIPRIFVKRPVST